MTGDVTTEWIGIFGEDACQYGKPDSHTRLDPKPRPLGDLLWAIGFRRPLTLLLTSILGLLVLILRHKVLRTWFQKRWTLLLVYFGTQY